LRRMFIFRQPTAGCLCASEHSRDDSNSPDKPAGVAISAIGWRHCRLAGQPALAQASSATQLNGGTAYERPQQRGASPSISGSAQLGENLVGAQAIGKIIHIAGKSQLIGLGLLQQQLQLGANLLRAADHRQAQELTHRLPLMG
jgi:hypothetical protein